VIQSAARKPFNQTHFFNPPFRETEESYAVHTPHSTYGHGQDTSLCPLQVSNFGAAASSAHLFSKVSTGVLHHISSHSKMRKDRMKTNNYRLNHQLTHSQVIDCFFDSVVSRLIFSTPQNTVSFL